MQFAHKVVAEAIWSHEISENLPPPNKIAKKQKPIPRQQPYKISQLWTWTLAAGGTTIERLFKQRLWVVFQQRSKGDSVGTNPYPKKKNNKQRNKLLPTFATSQVAGREARKWLMTTMLIWLVQSTWNIFTGNAIDGNPVPFVLRSRPERWENIGGTLSSWSGQLSNLCNSVPLKLRFWHFDACQAKASGRGEVNGSCGANMLPVKFRAPNNA